jgi:hypothetical protein
MKKQTVIPKKKRGPAPTGQGEPVVVRMHPPQLAALDGWIAQQQPPFPTRPEAVRRLVELGMTVRKKSKPPPVERATRAKELASKAIEKIADPSATQDERVQRRRRLTKGPQEFREDRVDMPQTRGK